MTDHKQSQTVEPDKPAASAVELGDLSTAPRDTHELDATSSGVHSSSQDEATRGGAETSDGASQAPEVVQPSSSRPRESTDGSPAPLPRPINTSAPLLERTATEAIGPPTELPTPMLQVPPSALAAGPVIQFTLLLASTGTRHPFQLNEKYLTKRNVQAKTEDGTFDPSTISVYSLKELILKDWREDWDLKPSSPSAIRLIFFGQLLADNVSLKECKLQTDGTANVLHITVKPQDAMDDEDAGKGGKSSLSRGRDGHSSGGCRCVMM